MNSDAFIGLNKEERDGISTISYQIRDMLPHRREKSSTVSSECKMG